VTAKTEGSPIPPGQLTIRQGGLVRTIPVLVVEIGPHE